jgi:Kelch motif
MESNRIACLNYLTIKYKDKVISMPPPKCLFRLKCELSKHLGANVTLSSILILHDKYEVNSNIYDNYISKSSTELTLLDQESDPVLLISLTAFHIYFFSPPYKRPNRLENGRIHWSSVSFSLPHKFPLLITGDTNWEINTDLFSIQDKPHMQFPRYYFASVVVLEYIYILGGVSIEGYTNICERYNTNTDQWEYIHSHIKPGKSGMAACQWGNLKIFLMGGLDGINYSDCIECYDVDLGIWKLLPVTLPWHTYYLGTAETERGILILGGKDNRECLVLDVSTLVFKHETALPSNIECTKFVQQSKRIGNFIYFMNLDGSVIQFNAETKKFEMHYDAKKNNNWD